MKQNFCYHGLKCDFPFNEIKIDTLQEGKIYSVLPKCTLEYDLKNGEWKNVNKQHLGYGGQLVKGKNNLLYFMGGFDRESRVKSKNVFEYQSKLNKWTKWESELPIPKEAKNAWDVMEIGPRFCQGRPNMTKSMTGLGAWTYNTALSSNERLKNLYDD